MDRRNANRRSEITWRNAFLKVSKALAREVWRQFVPLYEEETRLRSELQGAAPDKREELLQRVRAIERRKVDVLLRLLESWGVVPLQLASVKAGMVRDNPLLETALMLEQIDRNFYRIVNIINRALFRRDVPPEQASALQVKAAEQLTRVKEALQAALNELEKVRGSLEGGVLNEDPRSSSGANMHGVSFEMPAAGVDANNRFGNGEEL